VVLFSANVFKWSRFLIKQERTVVVTNLAIYSFHKKMMRRHIEIQNLAGLTKSLNEKSSEFVIHVKETYDYRMESSTRDLRE